MLRELNATIYKWNDFPGQLVHFDMNGKINLQHKPMKLKQETREMHSF